MTVTAVILPLGRTQFLDDAGEPLAGGSVGYYVPGGLVFKNTWQDPGRAALNENPVPLDAAGSAYIYGSGEYRMIVKNAAGTTIYDALTNGVVPASASGSGFGAQEPLASDATADLGTIDTHNVLLTGPNTIGSFGDSADLDAPLYYVEIDTGLIVTQSGAIETSGGEDLNLSAGDGLLCEFLGAGNWKVIAWWPAKGLSTGFGRMAALATNAGVADLGTINTNAASLTDAETVTSLGNSASLDRPFYLMYITQAMSFTNSVNIRCLGSADVAATPGATILWQFLGAGEWIMLFYGNADGSPLKNAYSAGRLLRAISYTTHGVYTYTRGAGATQVDVWVIGAGASGPGASVSSSGHAMASPGGSAGSHSRGLITGVAATVTVTVGQGGAAPAAGANDGNAGGDSSFGTAIVCGGATAPSHGADSSTNQINESSAPGAVSTAGNLFAYSGETGGNAYSNSNNVSLGGDGGSGPLGGRGVGGAITSGNANQGGGAARGPGSGGGGAVAGSAGGTQNAAGGGGADGAVYAWEYS